MKSQRLTGLIAATHTPFRPDGELNLAAVERQAEHLIRAGVSGAFIAGTTGESHSLTLEERLALVTRWSDVVRGTSLRLIIHVGSNCIPDARALAAQAQSLANVTAIAALAPSYFKPASLETLVDCCTAIAESAPSLPFYYYDIPVLTGVRFPMPAFLDAAADRIPTLAGIKFTNSDLMAYQQCLRSHAGRFDVLWGTDESLLAALALGATGAVGSTYNFAAPLYLRLMQAFIAGDLDTARQEQYRSVELIDLLAGLGYMPAAKAAMGFLGVDVGPARLPHARLSPDQLHQLRAGLDALGFFKSVPSI